MSIITNRREFFAQAAALTGATFLGGRVLRAAERSAGGTGGGEAVPLAPPDRQPPNLLVPGVPERKVGWAIVGLGELALGEIMPAFAQCRWSEPVALVSGHPDKARKVAAAYRMNPEAIYDYKNFDRLAEDRRVEVVYIVLPNSMHAEFTIRALAAGKHVLCEKPMAVSPEEGERMIAAAQKAGRTLGVGYRLHSEPLNRHVMELCGRKAFGKIKVFESSNAQNVLAPNIRLSGALGGGPLEDVGIYSINAARYCLGEEPVEVQAMVYQPKDDPRFREVPESMVYAMRYPSGVVARCDCSFGTTENRRFRVLGEKGWVEMDPAFSYRGLKLRMKQGEGRGAQTAEVAEIQMESVNHFAAEMDHFSDCVLHGKPLRTPGEMGLADLRIMAAIKEAARTGQTVKLAHAGA